MKITEPGVYAMKAEAYHADPCETPSLSSGGARKILAACPALYWYERNNPPEPTEALDIGNAAHEWLLEGETWPQRCVVLEDDFSARTKAGKSELAGIKDAGKRPIKAEDFDRIKAMVAALKEHPFAYAAFQNGKPEQSLFWRDHEYGIWRRARPDWLPDSSWIIPDYKTTRSAEPEYLRRAMYDYGYHQQAAWYLEAVKALGLYENPKFLFVFQEKTPPYLVTCITPDRVALDWADIMNRKAVQVFTHCLETGKWPGYADDVLTLGLPAWAEKKLVELHQAGAFQAPLNPPLAAE